MFLKFFSVCDYLDGRFVMRLFISLWFVVICFGFLGALGYGNAEDAVTINNKAVEYIEDGLLDEALILLEKAYGANGDDKVIRDNLVNAYNMRAKEYERKGDYDLCVGEYQKVLSRFSGDELTLKNFVTSLNNIGVRYNDRNEYKESLKYFQLAMNLLREFKDAELSKVVAVNYAGLLNKLAYEDYLNQDKVSAVGRLKRSLKLDSSNANTYQLLGEIYYDENNYDYARSYFEKSLRIHPSNFNLKKKLSMLLREEKVEKDFLRMMDDEKKFVICFQYDKDRERVIEIINLLNKAFKQIGSDLDFYPSQQISVKIYSSDQFLYVTGMPVWTEGLYDGKIRLKYDDFKSDFSLLKKTIYHELAHSMVSVLVKKDLPVWIQEGFAQYEEPDKNIDYKEMKLVLQKYKDKGIKELGFNDDVQMEFYDKEALTMLYVSSKLFVDYLINVYEINKFRTFLMKCSYEKSWRDAFRSAYGSDFNVLFVEWIRYLKWHLIGKD